MSLQPAFEYTASVVRIIDGDSLVASVDLGMHVSIVQHLRLKGIDAPERKLEEYEAGVAATEHLKDLLGAYTLDEGKTSNGRRYSELRVLIRTEKDKTGKYGRYIATLFGVDPETGETVNINEKMVEDGHAVKYE